ncbi:ribonuclease P protein component [Leptospira inadai]|uniref:Ribonuclease P protein component n=1 Tax=Leptospira inadai serovar Lyme TaxID=293084 RepID=A0ABX4YEG7_9LEPT|nr:ribonuclease P protein component [Leptospira inadai]PNV73103.1 ribonuclease P protein component [Leptospira inadai serovar Lyme]
MEETLTSRKDIRELFQSGKRISKSPLTLIYKANNIGYDRYLYCPERSVGSAVRRNRIKRRLRAAVAELAKGSSKGLDIAILAKPSLFELSYTELLSCLGHLMSRIQ